MGENFAHRLRWAHAVNSRRRLVRALTSDVHFIEADVACGPLVCPRSSAPDSADDTETSVRVEDGQPVIMAHYPTERSSDLSLENFVSFVLHYNEGTEKKDEAAGPSRQSGGSSSSHRRRSRAADAPHLCHEPAPGSSPSSQPEARGRDHLDPADISTDEEARAFVAQLDAELEEQSAQPLLPSCVGSRKAHQRKVENGRIGRADAKKGVKLDFKLWSCVEPTIEFLRKVQAAERLGGHLWLNADVFSGPGCMMSPLDAQKFVRLCAESIPKAVLSLGWGSTIISTTRIYTHEMIDRMIELCMYPIVKHSPQLSLPDQPATSASAVAAALAKEAPGGDELDTGAGLVVAPAAACLHITFAVSAEYALASADNLRRLLNTVPSASLTIYSGVGSLGVTPATAQEFLRAFGKGQCFFDLKVAKPWRSYIFGDRARNCTGAPAQGQLAASPAGLPAAATGTSEPRSSCWGPPSEVLPPKGPKPAAAQANPGLITIV